jgi:hypothetical protein
MLTPKLKRTTLGLVLVNVALLGLTAEARADEGTAPPTGVQQALATANQQALATAAPSSVSSSAEGAAGALQAASEQPAQPEPKAGADGPSPAGQSPPSPPQAAGTDISEAVKEATAQASTKQPQEAPRPEQESHAAASNATAQLIWQVEVSQCASRCDGTKQYQRAEQQNTTRQEITSAPASVGAPASGRAPAPGGAPAPGADQGAPATGERSQATSNVTQIQFGCLSYCFGTTTTKQPPLAPYGQVLAEFLRQVTTALSGLSPAPASEQSAVEQVTFQSQNAAGGTLTQVQSAAQSSATIQSYTSTLIAGLASVPGGPQAPSGEAVSQTEQGIWQLQIGCLFLCHETVQYQQAEQSNATRQTIVSTPGSAANASASASDIVTQVIWQVQIGCLFWCFDTTEWQIGTTHNELTVTHSERAAAPPSAQATSISPGAENEVAPRPATASSQALAEAPGPPPAGWQGSTGAPPPPSPSLATLQTSTAWVDEGAAIPHEASSTSAGSDRRDASPARSSTARPPANSDVRRADVPGGLAKRRAQQHRLDGVSVHLSAKGLAQPLGAVAAGRAFGSSGRRAPGHVGVLLAVIALCGVGCLRIAVIRTRRGSRASHQGRLTSE